MTTCTNWLGRFVALAMMIGMLGSFTASAATEAEEAALAIEDEFPWDQFYFRRMLDGVKEDVTYRLAQRPSDKLMAWRGAIKHLEERGNPISRRYIVTCYGGVIDMRNFLNAAALAYDKGPDQAAVELLRQEGGLMSNDRPSSSEIRAVEASGVVAMATPEDMPSIAFGILYAERIRDAMRNQPVNYDRILIDLLRPLKPVPDNIAAKFSFSDLVFNGVPLSEKNMWFKATPNTATDLINTKGAEAGLGQLCDPVKDGEEGLKKAGYKVVNVGTFPIRIVEDKEEK